MARAPLPDPHERPTVPPPFDMEAFARSSMAPAPAGSGNGPALAIAEQPVGQVPRAVSGVVGPIEPMPVVTIEEMPGPTVVDHTIDDPSREMRDALARGDYREAIELAELILVADPGDAAAQECRATGRTLLERSYAARLRPAGSVPVLAAGTEVDLQHIDHRAPFLLSFVDGASTLESIAGQCGMPRLDVLRIFDALVREGIVRLA